MNPIMDITKDKIERFGHILLGVFDTVDEFPGDTSEIGQAPFIYTIGMAADDLPEFLILGAASNAFGIVLNDLCQRARANGAFQDGQLVSLGGNYPVRIIDADDRAQRFYTIQAGQYWQRQDYRVQQVLVPDKQGRFAGEPGCSEPYCNVPVLAARPH